MASGAWRGYLKRSLQSVHETMGKAARMEISPPRTSKKLLTLTSPEDMTQFATGCDSDIGGFSTCHLDLGPDGKGRFWGEMSTKVQPGLENRVKSGYAAFRSKVRSSLFGEMYFDVERHDYLHLRVKGGGDRRTRDAYFVNLQTETPVTSDIWQHRLFLRGSSDWEDIYIPFNTFVLTNYGQPVQDRIRMNREKVRTIGISILGGKFAIEGNYELGIESIYAVNEHSDSSSETS